MKQLVQLNLFISNIKIESIDIQILQNFAIVHRLCQRKVAGQFATPPQLADLLTRITINNKNGITLDPFVVEQGRLLSKLILKKNMKWARPNY